MTVYFVRSGKTGPVKIGLTGGSHPTGRVRTLQTGHWEELTVIRSIDGDRNTETWLHEFFDHLRLRGEWFTFHEDMLKVIPPEVEDIPHGWVLTAFGGPRQLAKIIGLDPGLACHWGRRGIPARYWFDVEDAAVSRNIPITARDLWRMASQKFAREAA